MYSDRVSATPPEICTVEVAVEIVGGKWKLAAVKVLLEGTHRFNELHRSLPGVTPRMLTRQLRELERDGIIHREVYAEVPPRVEYSLTPVGESLREIVHLLDEWGDRFQHLAASARIPRGNGAQDHS